MTYRHTILRAEAVNTPSRALQGILLLAPARHLILNNVFVIDNCRILKV